MFTQEPEQAAARFQSSSRLVEGFECEVQSRGFSIIIDEPEMLGGTGKGPNPVEVVLSALGVCQELTYRLFAYKMEIPITGVSVAVVGNINLRSFLLSMIPFAQDIPTLQLMLKLKAQPVMKILKGCRLNLISIALYMGL